MHECPICGQLCSCDGKTEFVSLVEKCDCTCWVDDLDETDVVSVSFDEEVEAAEMETLVDRQE